jgi:hypothetical protein
MSSFSELSPSNINLLLTAFEVDWDAVAEEQNLKSAAVAKVRYGQIKNKCGMTAVPPGVKAAVTKEPKTPTKRKTPAKASGSAKKDGEIGSGTNTSPSKVVKKRATPKKSVKSAPKVEHDDDEDEDDKNAAAQLSKIEDEDKDVKSFVSKFATVTSDEEAM